MQELSSLHCSSYCTNESVSTGLKLGMETCGEPSVVLEINTSGVMVDGVFEVSQCSGKVEGVKLTAIISVVRLVWQKL